MSAGWELQSGKFAVLATLMDKLRRETTDRIVIVSNYTQTLDLVQTLCKERNVSRLPPLLPQRTSVGVSKPWEP